MELSHLINLLIQQATSRGEFHKRNLLITSIDTITQILPWVMVRDLKFGNEAVRQQVKVLLPKGI